MIRPPESGIRRWREEVARDPASPSFVPLADLYRVQGRLEVARRVCLRGLERQPTHVEAHYLLGRIYRDGDDPEKAYDEWDIALRLDPLHAPSRRAIAFLCLERGELREAEKHLVRALEADPDDPRLHRALRLARGDRQRAALGPAYWDAVAALLHGQVQRFSVEARVRMVAVLDRSGRVITQHRVPADLDLAGIASLVAAVHATAGELARLLGQGNFSQLYQGRGDHQIFMGSIAAPAGDLLLLAVFGPESPVGLVRSLFRDLTRSLAVAAWPDVPSGPTGESLDEHLAAGLARATGRRLPAPAGWGAG